MFNAFTVPPETSLVMHFIVPAKLGLCQHLFFPLCRTPSRCHPNAKGRKAFTLRPFRLLIALISWLLWEYQNPYSLKLASNSVHFLTHAMNEQELQLNEDFLMLAKQHPHSKTTHYIHELWEHKGVPISSTGFTRCISQNSMCSLYLIT
jgi:hypothetical protein